MVLASLARVARQTFKKAIFGTTASVISMSGLFFAAPLFLSSPAYAASATWTVTGSGACDSADHNCSSIPAAVSAAASGDTINVEAGTYNLTSELDINVPMTITGQGSVTIKSNNSSWDTTNNGKHIIGIYAGTSSNPVTISNVTIDSNSQSYGVNTYSNAYGILSGVTIKDSKGAGLTVNGSTIVATNLNTSNNSWGAVNVDPGSGVTTASIFTLNSGTLSESNQIWSDGSHVNASTGATVTVNASGYTEYHISDNGYNVWANKSLTNVASITKNSTTTYYSTIQAAVNAASSGDTVDVAPGTYSETVSVSTPLTINGAQAGVAGASTSGTQRSGSESTVKEFNITSSNVTINGFSLNNAGTQVNITSSTTLSGINIENNVFSGYSSVGMPTYDAGNLTIQNNYFTSPASSSEPMQIKASSVQGGCNGTTVKNNVFNYATNNGSADINFSCTGSNSSNVTVSGNTDLGNTGGTSFVSFAGFSDGINVTNNTVTNMSGSAVFFWGGVTGSATISGNSITSGSSNAVSIQDMGASYGTNSGTFTVENNDLSGNSFGVKVGSGALSGSGSVNAAQNYWGSGVNPSTLVSSGVTYAPYYLDSAKTILSTGDSLTGLSLSSGTLSPTFSSGTTSYTAAVANSVSSVTPTYTSSTGSTVTINSVWSNLAVGSNTATLTVQSADGTASQTYTVTITRAAATQTVPDSSGSATVTSSTPTLVVTSTSTPLTVTVSSGTTNATIDYSALLNTSTNSATVPQTTIQSSTANVQIPSGTVITASGTWDGIIKAPTVQSAASISIPTSSGTLNTVGTVIEVGSSTVNLTFDKAVRLLIPGQAGTLVGYQRNGVFTQITNPCSADSQAAGDALSAGGDCYISVGSDMVVWTKHFTTFATYTKNNSYTVVYGDTMSGIAYKFGLTLAKLEALNPSAGHPAGNFSLIMPGDVLSVGSAVLTASASTGSGSSVLGSSTGGLIGSAASTTNNASPQVKSAQAAASAASATATSKWYWWVIAGVIVVALGTVWYIYRLADNDKKSA